MQYQPFQTFDSLPEKKKNLFMSHCLIEFAVHSFKGASLNQIARDAGIAKGSIYQYFKDKKHLYLYLVQSAMNVKVEKLREQLRENMHLFAFLRAIKSEKLALDQKFAAFLVKAATENAFDEIQVIIRETSGAFFLELVERSTAVLKDTIDPKLVVFILTTLFTHFGKFLFVMDSSEEREAAYESLIDFLEHGMRR